MKNRAWLAGISVGLAFLLAGCRYVPRTDEKITNTGGQVVTVNTKPTERPLQSLPDSPDEGFSIDFLKTGKSDCAIIQIDGKVILSDTADSDDFELICQKLNAYEIQRIDYMILSHLDNDHIGSAAMLIRKYEVGVVYQPDYTRDSKLYEALVAAVNNTDTVLCVIQDDLTIETEQGSIWINPPASSGYEDENDYSLITTITYKNWSVLLMGDAQRIRTGEFTPLAAKQYNLIKLPHHGSWNKGLKAFLAQTSAEAYIVCAADLSTVEAQLPLALGDALYYTFDGEIHVCVDDQAMYMVG